MNRETFERNVAFITEHKDKHRLLQKGTNFISFGNNAIRLLGWSTDALCEYLSLCKNDKNSKKKITMEILVPDSGIPAKRRVGDIVSKKNVFVSSEGAVFEGDKIAFCTKEGLYIDVDQFLYLEEHGSLNQNQFFGAAERNDNGVASAWKYQLRRAAEARKDKGVQILYLTVGAIDWQTEFVQKGGKKRARSPLFLAPAREEAGKGNPKFSLSSTSFLQNATLARLIRDEYEVEIYRDLPLEIPFEKLSEAMKQVEANLAESKALKLYQNDLHVCLLDSTNEMICQAVERRIEQIASCPLISVFSGAEKYEPKTVDAGFPTVYPWAADDTQRELIRRAAAGESVNGRAGPGAGKSQSCCNVIVNAVLRGKRVCVISEKAAALEVIYNYMAKRRLDGYCLMIDEKVGVKSVVSQIKRSIAASPVYVEPEGAKAALAGYREACVGFENFNRIYENDPSLGTSLYSVIGEAMAKEDLLCGEWIRVKPEDYQTVCRKLRELQTQQIDTLEESEWKEYLQSNSTGDAEEDELLDEAIGEMSRLGFDLRGFVLAKNPDKALIAAWAISQIARKIATQKLEELSLDRFGNRRLRVLYRKLLESASALEAVSAAFVRQEFGRMVKNAAAGSEFVELLDRLGTARISLQDFFGTYGGELLKLCPVLMGTPSALAPYEKLNAFDLLIIDESSQLPFTHVLPFLTGNRQLVAFGDPMQLDVTGFFTRTDLYRQKGGEEFDLASTDKSILHVVQGKLPGCQLQYHYRSKTEHLITVSNLRCYEGLLNIAPDCYFGKDNLPEELGSELVLVPNLEFAKSGAILSEARELVDRVIEVRKASPGKSIGIITFNEIQQSAINDEIDRRIDEEFSLYDLLNLQGDKLFLRTLENAQGKEADVVFISVGRFTRKKDGGVRRQISILNQDGAENRLNVLFTRAKEKIVVLISFDYRELRGAEKGIGRLYEYLRYIDTGECDGSLASFGKEVDRYNEILREKVASIAPGYQVIGRVGHADLTVDAALVKEGSRRFAAGLLFPGKVFSPNSICTKVSVLERAGWKLLPLSPVTCFTRPESFSDQLKKDLEEGVSFSQPCKESYLTENRPPELLSLEDFSDGISQKWNLTKEEFLAVDYLAAYAEALEPEVLAADFRTAEELDKAGNLQAKFKRCLFSMDTFVKKNRLDDLRQFMEQFYKRDPIACYLLAQLLRLRGDPVDAERVQKLLAEARRIGVKVE